VCRPALNFLDFLVLFHQGKRTRKKNKKRFNETQLLEDAVALKVDGRINPAHAGFNETHLSEDAVALKNDGRIPVCRQGRNPENPAIRDTTAVRDTEQFTSPQAGKQQIIINSYISNVSFILYKFASLNLI